ncbi:fatty acyl-AMP ligase [Streptomyces sp. NPDC004579]|uniref:fatty acyl-AMP ligase n=1 Tax=Streptomyces sp. NPDC004579 TaxID=3154667 RepID=UPI0033A14B13
MPALPLDTIVTRLERNARELPDKDAVVFVRPRGDERVEERLTFGRLREEARALARWLRGHCADDERVLLLYPSGTDFVKVLVGCLYAGVVAVPAPAPSGGGRRAARMAGVARDADVTMVLTDSAHLAAAQEFLQDAGLGALPCVATDTVEFGTEGELPEPRYDGDKVAILQYTSGSTSDPKGVLLTHGALAHNLWLIETALGPDRETRACSWLPPYHDMGLIGMLLSPLYLGAGVVLISPMDFLRRPRLWFELIQEHRSTFTTAPNFAYDLLAKHITDEQLAGLDLSSLRWALNGSEPIDARTLERFGTRFAAAGFDPRALKPCYGMAETALFVAGTPSDSGPVITSVDTADLEKNLFTPSPAGPAARQLVSSGRVVDLDVRIVDPESAAELPDGSVGEIWVRGGSVTTGYWRNPEQTARAFDATTAAGERGFVRTGDLGARHDGELYVTGRIKDVLIVRGRNLYPHDIEREVVALHEAFQGLQTCVCAVPAAREEIVVLQEFRVPAGMDVDPADVTRTVRGELGELLGVRVSNVVLLRPGHVRRTSSGKVQRSLMRDLFMAGGLKPLHEDLDAEIVRRYRTQGAAV